MHNFEIQNKTFHSTVSNHQLFFWVFIKIGKKIQKNFYALILENDVFQYTNIPIKYWKCRKLITINALRHGYIFYLKPLKYAKSDFFLKNQIFEAFGIGIFENFGWFFWGGFDKWKIERLEKIKDSFRIFHVSIL